MRTVWASSIAAGVYGSAFGLRCMPISQPHTTFSPSSFCLRLPQVIGLTWQIGSLNRDLDILEMRYNILIGQNSHVEDQRVSAVARRSSEFAKRIHGRFGDSPVRSVSRSAQSLSRSGSFKLTAASPSKMSPKMLHAAEGIMTKRINAHTALLRQKERELGDAEAELAALEGPPKVKVSATSPTAPSTAVSTRSYSAGEAEMMVHELLSTRLALAAAHAKHEALTKRGTKKTLRQRISKAVSKPFKRKSKAAPADEKPVAIAPTVKRALIVDTTTSYVPLDYGTVSYGFTPEPGAAHSEAPVTPPL
jgi:hypothetical protein